MDPVEALRRIAYLLERQHQPTYRVRAYRRAAETLARVPADELAERVRNGTLRDLPGVGEKTAAIVVEAVSGKTPTYLQELEATLDEPVATGGAELRALLRGDLHVHSDWSDGHAPIEQMARAARELGHEYFALTDHSPRLTVANGLTAERLRQQLDIVSKLNDEMVPFRILTGIEVDINEDGTLDQTDELLGELDVVVASVHSKLRSPSDVMTERMVRAIANPYTDILGHCTGRLIMGERGRRPESEFDAEIVLEACRQFGVAVEINSRPERLDPPRRLLRQAVETGCLFSIDTDAHAPGQLDWQPYGTERAVDCGVPPERIIDTWALDELLTWTRRKRP